MDIFWVTDFPLFEQDGDEGSGDGLTATHHPFTAPIEEDAETLWRGDALRVRGQHYDLVANGMEIGGGSIRIHDSNMQRHVLDEILGLDSAQSSTFGHLLDALAHGCPPHGGIALGLDRLTAMMCDADSIRDVIAFPKSAAGNDLLSGAPAELTSGQLAEYHLLK